MRTQLIAATVSLVLCSVVSFAVAAADTGARSSPTMPDWRSIPCCPDPAATQPPLDGVGFHASFGVDLRGIAYDDDDGFLYVADKQGDVIRRVSTNGVVTTYAGDCERNVTSGNCQGEHIDGDRLTARFDQPDAIAYDPADRSLYVTELGPRDVRRITPDGVVSTVSWAELVMMPLAIAFDGASSTMDITDGSHIFRLTTAGAKELAQIRDVFGLTFDGLRRRMVFEDLASVGTIGADGSRQPLAGNCIEDAKSDIWSGCRAGTIDGAGTDAVFNHIQGLAFDGKDGAIYIADWNAVRRATADGAVTTVVGSCVGSLDEAIEGCPEGNQDGPRSIASFGIIRGITYDSRDDVLYVLDEPNREIRRVSLDGDVKTIAGSAAGALDRVSAWSAQYGWSHAHEKLVTQVRDNHELELFYRDGRLFEVRSGRRNAEYQSDLELFSIRSSYDGFVRSGSYNGPPIIEWQALLQLGCDVSFTAYAPSDGHITAGDTTFGKWSLQSAASSNCRALRVVDPSGNVDFQDYERTDVKHEDPSPSWVRLT